MVTEQRKRAPPEVVEQFRLAALRALEDLGAQLDPLWQQLRCGAACPLLGPARALWRRGTVCMPGHGGLPLQHVLAR